MCVERWRDWGQKRSKRGHKKAKNLPLKGDEFGGTNLQKQVYYFIPKRREGKNIVSCGNNVINRLSSSRFLGMLSQHPDVSGCFYAQVPLLFNRLSGFPVTKTAQAVEQRGRDLHSLDTTMNCGAGSKKREELRINRRTTNKGIRNGNVVLVIRLNEISATLAVTYTTTPIGGVNVPIIRFNTMISPKWIGLMPNFRTTGKRIGIRII